MTVTRSRENGQARPQARAPQTLEEHLEWVNRLALEGGDLVSLSHGLLREKFQLLAALEQVRDLQGELREQVRALTAPPLFPVVITDTSSRERRVVEVHGGGQHLRVSVHPDVPVEQLRVGALGVLAKERNCLLDVWSSRPIWSEVGSFESYVDERQRALVRYQEELMAVTLADELRDVSFRKGDLVGFTRDGARMAYARVEPPSKEHLFFEDTPPDHFGELGGLDREITLLKRVVSFRLKHADIAQRYQLPSKHGILFEGPPGNGKTKLARCLANFIAGLVPSGQCRFMAVSGSADYSMWLGQSEQKLIARFEAARQLASDGGVPVVMFFDEIDAIGRRRGADLGSTASDRILATFLSQLDGVKQISNLIVIGATNRADVLDNGLIRPGRLGDIRVRLSAPNRQAARAILARYLVGGLPLAADGEAVIEAMLSRIYSPRSDHSELVRVTMRDGRKIVVGARDLVSGAIFENLVRTAAEEAADREILTGEVGITEADLMNALERQLRSLSQTLTAANVRSYTTRLPADVEAVGVEVLHRA